MGVGALAVLIRAHYGVWGSAAFVDADVFNRVAISAVGVIKTEGLTLFGNWQHTLVLS